MKVRERKGCRKGKKNSRWEREQAEKEIQGEKKGEGEGIKKEKDEEQINSDNTFPH